jgi:hypothetical protein
MLKCYNWQNTLCFIVMLTPFILIENVTVFFKLSGYYMNRQFNIQQFYVLPTQCIYVFCVDVRINSDYFSIQH